MGILLVGAVEWTPEQDPLGLDGGTAYLEQAHDAPVNTFGTPGMVFARWEAFASGTAERVVG
ncbi:MAG: hypothetical protein ACYC1C_02480 [Chloroflexota bacterium]